MIPGTRRPYSNRGYAYRSKRQYDEAIADLTKAIEIDPRDADAYNNRGYAYRRKGQLDQAIADLTKALEIDPKLVNAYSNRGAAYEDKKEYERAISDYSKAIEIDPGDADYYNGRAWAYLQGRQGSTGSADAEKSLQLRPNDANTLDTRGHILEALGRREDSHRRLSPGAREGPQHQRQHRCPEEARRQPLRAEPLLSDCDMLDWPCALSGVARR